MLTEAPQVFDVRLKDGNRLIQVRAGLPITCISAWLDAGGKFDPVGKEGLAHFLEHLHMKTSPRFPDAKAMQDHHAAKGINYNAFTSTQRMWFRFCSTEDRAHDAVRHFLEVFSTSYIDEAMYVTEKNVIEDERRKRMAMPARQLLELSKHGLYHGTPLEQSVLGTKESLSAVTLEDVRGFFDARVVNAAKTFVVVSDMVHEELLAFFEDLWSPAIPRDAAVSTDFLPPLPEVKKASTATHAEVSLNFRTCPAREADDVLALDLLCQSYLTGRSSSRLGTRLRLEQSLTYGICCSTENAAETGHAMFRFSVSPEHVEKSLAVCNQEIRRVCDGEISFEDLEASKEDFAFHLRKYSMDPENVASWYAYYAFAGIPLRTVDEVVSLARKLEAQDLQRVARKYLHEGNRSVAILGPLE